MRDSDGRPDWTRPVAAALSLGAAAIHFSVVGEHYAEYPIFGLLFAAVAWFQAGWAVWFALRPGRMPALLAVLINVGVVFGWAMSRTTGLPLGPEPWLPEPVGALDLAATGFEVALIGLLARRWRRLGRPANRFTMSPSAVAMGAGIVAVVIVTSAALGLSGGTGHSGSGHEHGHSATTSEVPRSDDHQPASPDVGSKPSTAGMPPPASGMSPAAPAKPLPVASAPSPSPSAATNASTQEPGSIVFGRDVDAAGRITDPVNRFAAGEVGAWIVNLESPPNDGTLQFVVAARLRDGREIQHWKETLDHVDPSDLTLVSIGRLSDFGHGGTGTYVMRYLAGDRILAEGVYEVTR